MARQANHPPVRIPQPRKPGGSKSFEVPAMEIDDLTVTELDGRTQTFSFLLKGRIGKGDLAMLQDKLQGEPAQRRRWAVARAFDVALCRFMKRGRGATEALPYRRG